MNKETYKALKRIMAEIDVNLRYGREGLRDAEQTQKDFNQVDGWIDEVAKEYE